MLDGSSSRYGLSLLLQGFAISKGEPDPKLRIPSTKQCPWGSFGYVAFLTSTGSSFPAPPLPAHPSLLLSRTLSLSPGLLCGLGYARLFSLGFLNEHLRFFVAAHLVLYLSCAAGVGPQLLVCVCSWLFGGH